MLNLTNLRYGSELVWGFLWLSSGVGALAAKAVGLCYICHWGNSVLLPSLLFSYSSPSHSPFLLHLLAFPSFYLYPLRPSFISSLRTGYNPGQFLNIQMLVCIPAFNCIICLKEPAVERHRNADYCDRDVRIWYRNCNGRLIQQWMDYKQGFSTEVT